MMIVDDESNSQTHVLIADDDPEILALLEEFLTQYDFKVTKANDGEEILQIFNQDPTQYDLIILDILMPGIDGLNVCKTIRRNNEIPIIMLTAVSDDIDRIIGLECGADDYLPKPFNPRELLARIRAVLRRTQLEPSNRTTEQEKLARYRFAGWVLNTANRVLTSPDDLEVSLSSTSYDLLLIFLTHAQRVLTRDQLIDWLYNREAGPYDRTVDVQVSRLRQRIEGDPKKPQFIKTVRSGGYIFASEVEQL